MIISRLSGRMSTPKLLIIALLIIFAVIGAYLFLPSHAASCLSADFNNDKAINAMDLSILAANWGKSGASQSMGDANGDSAVNIYDLSALASEWGQTCPVSPTPTPTTTPTPTPTPTTSPSQPPIPGGPLFNVLDPTYGAVGDGVHNDAPAIQKAFDDADAANGGTVLLPSGHTYYVSSGWDMPAIKTNDWLGQTSPDVHRTGIVTVYGYGATIKYASSIGRTGWMQSGYPPSIWTTFGDLVIEGMTIDNNYAESPGELGRILWIHDANAENITVRGVTMEHVSARTAYNSPDSLCGVFIKENFSTPTPGHRAFERNITITDSTIAAQEKPIFIGSDGYGEATYGYGDAPMVVDNIDIERVNTDNTGHIGTGIHLGSYASGGTAKVIDVTATNSSDNLIEIDAFNDVTVQNVKLSKAQSGIGFTWFSFPYLATTPTYRIDNVTYSGGNAPYWPIKDSSGNPVATEPAARRNSEGTVFLGAVSGSGGSNLLSRSWGNMIMKGGNLTNGEVNAFGIAQPAIKYGGNFASVDIEDVNITDIDSLNVGGALLYVKQLGSSTMPLTLSNINYRASTNGTFQPLPSSRMTLSGPYTLNP